MLNTIKDNYTKALSENLTEYAADLIIADRFIEDRQLENLSTLIKDIIKNEESKPKSQRLENYHLLVEANALLMDYTEKIYG